MPSWMLAIILALLSAGFGLSVFSILRGVDLFRGRTARTEARGIAFIERTWRDDEWAKRVAIHRMEFYRDEQNPYLRARIGDLEYIIRTELGPNHVPAWAPAPVLGPLPPRPEHMMMGEGKEDDRASATAELDGGP
jgi:hypothetical protein